MDTSNRHFRTEGELIPDPHISFKSEKINKHV